MEFLKKISSIFSKRRVGSCGVVGQISVLETMGYDNPMAYIAIFGVQIIGTILLTLLFDFLCKDIFHLYQDEDLKLQA